MLETRQMGKLVQHHKMIQIKTKEIFQKFELFSMLSFTPRYQIHCKSDSFAVVMSKTNILTIFKGKWALLLLSFSYPKHIYRRVEHNWKLTFLAVKVHKPNSS